MPAPRFLHGGPAGVLASRHQARAARRLRLMAGIAMIVTAQGACTIATATSTTVAAPPGTLPGWSQDDLAGVAQALHAQCALPRPPGHWVQTCARLPAAGELRAFIEREFVAWPLQAQAATRPGLLTGYHEPLLRGSRERESAEQEPIYALPAVVPAGGYPSRAAVDAGALAGAPVIAWADDPIEAFFLHIQGSGRMLLRDGTSLRLGFAGHNGQPYRAIGRELIARGELTADSIDADAIKAWLRAHPHEARALMQLNPRYIFFRVLDQLAASQGPIGSLGVPLTPMRSVAADPERLSPGALVYMDAAPLEGPGGEHRWQRLSVVQDTGAAIRGAVRLDLFTGSDAAAALTAARLRQSLAGWLLVPRGVPPSSGGPQAAP